MKTRKLWIGFGLVILFSFAILAYFGTEIYREAPPLPDMVVNEAGETVITGARIRDGQNVWQSIGGQEIGTVWGHGAYKAPDWTADWLHREAEFLLDKYARDEYGVPYGSLDEERQAQMKARLERELRTNRYDPATGILTISAARHEAFREISRHYQGLFMDDPSKASLRESYSIPENSIKDEERMSWMNAFFFWATWATVTERPGKEISYTNNWPPEELVGNRPTGAMLLWTGFSVILLLAGIGLLTWYYVSTRDKEEESPIPEVNPLSPVKLTPSMKATLKYFWVVTALILVQILADLSLCRSVYQVVPDGKGPVAGPEEAE